MFKYLSRLLIFLMLAYAPASNAMWGDLGAELFKAALEITGHTAVHMVQDPTFYRVTEMSLQDSAVSSGLGNPIVTASNLGLDSGVDNLIRPELLSAGSNSLVPQRRNVEFIPAAMATNFLKGYAERLSSAAKNSNPVIRVVRAAETVSAAAHNTVERANEAYKKISSTATSIGSNITPRNIIITAFILSVMYHSAKPLANRISNSGFDLFENSFKGTFKGLGKAAGWTSDKIGRFLRFIFRLGPNFFKRVLRDDLILNDDVKELLGHYALLSKIISEAIASGEGHMKYQNIVLSGEDFFVKNEYSKDLAHISGQEFVVIDHKSSLFNHKTTNSVRYLPTGIDVVVNTEGVDSVKQYFDLLIERKNTSLIMFDLTNIDMSKPLIKERVIDILAHAKLRSDKFGFVFICKSMDNNLKDLLEGCYDSVADIKKPDYFAREKIVGSLIKEIILDDKSETTFSKIKNIVNISALKSDGTKPLWSSFNMKSNFISSSKRNSFEKYLTQDKFDFIVSQLEGRSYSEVISFVINLRALLGNKVLGSQENYNSVINILLNKSETDFPKQLSTQAA